MSDPERFAAMSDPERFATMTADVLRRFLPGVRPAQSRNTPGSASMLAAVEYALMQRARRGALRKTAWRVCGLSAAAAILLASTWVVSRRFSPGTADRFASSQPDRVLTVLGDTAASLTPGTAVIAGHAVTPVPLRRGMLLESGTGLVAPAAAEVRIGTADGTLLTMEKAGELILGEQHLIRRFSLVRGAVRAQVTKLRSGDRFIIATDDAEVEVHGTVFRVSIVPGDPACGGGIKTRVSVAEGVVSVRANGSEAFVPAGAVWPEGCAHLRVPVKNGPAEDRPVAGAVGPRHSTAGSPRLAALSMSGRPTKVSKVAKVTTIAGYVSDARIPTSALREQNDLFAEAIHARQQGRIDDSVRLLSQLTETYPDGPLAEDAMVQNMRLLANRDTEAAARAASSYLRHFPGGFALAEARRLADASP